MSAALPEPIAEGDLARTPFAHLLLSIHQKALSGTLVVWDPTGEEGRQQDRVRFASGQPVAGRLLERASRLDRGMLPLFARESGPFAFYEDVDLVGDSEHARTGCIDVRALIAASLRGSSRDDAVERVVSGLGDARLRFVSGADLEPFQLLPDESTCLELIRAAPSSVSALEAICPLDARAVRRLVYLGVITKQLEAWDGTSSPALPRRPMSPARGTQKAPKPERERERRSSSKPGRGPEPPPPAPDRLEDRHRAHWEEIRARALAIETENYFDMLGVPRDASTKAIETAYYGLVKKWHPDRIPPELTELRPAVERVFQYLTRAQETLTDDDRRGPYLATVQEGGGTPEAERELGEIVQAAMDFRKVEILMRRRDWKGALELLEPILEASPDEAHYHATRGHLRRMIDPTDRRVRGDLQKALALSDALDVAHYEMGLILKEDGDTTGAIKHFERAAELNPRNIDAARMVRLARMRGQSSAPPDDEPRGDKKGGSFFGKLFKSGKKS